MSTKARSGRPGAVPEKRARSVRASRAGRESGDGQASDPDAAQDPRPGQDPAAPPGEGEQDGGDAQERADAKRRHPRAGEDGHRHAAEERAERLDDVEPRDALAGLPQPRGRGSEGGERPAHRGPRGRQGREREDQDEAEAGQLSRRRGEGEPQQPTAEDRRAATPAPGRRGRRQRLAARRRPAGGARPRPRRRSRPARPRGPRRSRPRRPPRPRRARAAAAPAPRWRGARPRERPRGAPGGVYAPGEPSGSLRAGASWATIPAPLEEPMKRAVALAGLLVALSPPAPAEEPAVRAWESPLRVPTYPVGPAEPNPMFYAGREYQGAQGARLPLPAPRPAPRPAGGPRLPGALAGERVPEALGPARDRRAHLHRPGQDERLRLLLSAARDQAGPHRDAGGVDLGRGRVERLPPPPRDHLHARAVGDHRERRREPHGLGGRDRVATADAVGRGAHGAPRSIVRGGGGPHDEPHAARPLDALLLEPRGPHERELPGALPARRGLGDLPREDRLRPLAAGARAASSAATSRPARTSAGGRTTPTRSPSSSTAPGSTSSAATTTAGARASCTWPTATRCRARSSGPGGTGPTGACGTRSSPTRTGRTSSS